MTHSLVGNVLVASTLVTESVFARGVCLMMHHDDDGAIAVMLNRPIWPAPAGLLQMISGENDEITASEPPAVTTSRLQEQLLPAVPVPPTPAALPSAYVHFGGPLSGPVLAIHSTIALSEGQTGNGIYVAAQKEHLEQLVREKPSDYRLIIGHAGWGAGQLDTEVNAGMWHVLPATPQMVFGFDSDLWPILIRRATGSSLSHWVSAPDNPAATALN